MESQAASRLLARKLGTCGWLNRRPPIGAAAGRSLRKLSGVLFPAVFLPRRRHGGTLSPVLYPPPVLSPIPRSVCAPFRSSAPLPFTMTFIELLAVPPPSPPRRLVPTSLATPLEPPCDDLLHLLPLALLASCRFARASPRPFFCHSRLLLSPRFFLILLAYGPSCYPLARGPGQSIYRHVNARSVLIVRI